MIFIAIFPIVAAIIGWLVFKVFSMVTQQTLFKQKQQFIKLILDEVATINWENTLQQISSENSLEKINPIIEQKIDDFIQHKLPSEIPVLKMLAGDKILEQAKSIVLAEVKTALPQTLNEAGKLMLQPDTLIPSLQHQLSQLSQERWDNLIERFSAPMLSKIQVAGTILGFILGILFIIFILVYGYIYNLV